MTGAGSEAHRPRMFVLALTLTAAVAVLGIAAIWTLAVPLGPEACALTMPGPRNCFELDRARAAVFPTIAIGLLGAAIISVAVFFSPQSRRVVVFVGPVILLIASIAGYVSAAWIPSWA